jgi:hypothetical protein
MMLALLSVTFAPLLCTPPYVPSRFLTRPQLLIRPEPLPMGRGISLT